MTSQELEDAGVSLTQLRSERLKRLQYTMQADGSVPAIPEKYLPLRDDLMVHGAGLEDEGPIIYPDGQAGNPEAEYLQENMALCLECYVGAVGGSCGVKLEDQLLVTPGARSCCVRIRTTPACWALDSGLWDSVRGRANGGT